MDKMIGQAVQKVMGEGEKKAPVKDIKLKIKFQKEDKEEEEDEENNKKDKSDKEHKKKEIAKKMKKEE